MKLAGIDLSLRATALVAVPLDWDGDWRRVTTWLCGYQLTDAAPIEAQVARTSTIAAQAVAFCQRNEVAECWLESPAFNQRTSQHRLGELHGVVKLRLLEAGVGVRYAQQTTARKLLLGTVPRSEQKQAVQAALLAGGAPPGWSLDECDAFCAVNLGLSERGNFCFAQRGAA